jgi:putative salt-induced outer membrane protein YdiY
MIRSPQFALFLSLALAAPAAADLVRLTNGDVLTGTIVEQTDAGVVLDHAQLGRVTLKPEQVQAAVTGKAKLPPAPAAPRAGVFGTGFLAGWTKQVQLGLSGASGNTENADFLGGLKGAFENDTRRWAVDSGYFYSSEEGDTTKDEAFVAATRDFLFPTKRYFVFLSGRYDYDQFEDWDHRLNLASGLGYSFIDTETFDLRGRGGFGVTKTFGSPGNDKWDPEAVIGVETEWVPTERQKLKAYDTFFPSLADTGEFRNLTGIDWTLAISDGLGLSLNLGLQNEYESDVEPGTEKNDLLYHASLLYDF